MNTEARFYNGVSSASIPVFVTNDPQNQQLIVEVAEGELPLTILYKDIEITHSESMLFVFSFGVNPKRIIEIKNKEFRDEFLKFNKTNKGEILYHRLLSGGMRMYLLFTLFVIGFCALAYFYLMPFLAENAVELLPRSFDKKLGDVATAQFIEYEIQDSLASVKANSYLKEMIPDEAHNFHITVLKSKEVNAFALPNGEIVVYRSMLNKLKSSDEFAGLLAHEMSHVNNRHSVKLMAKNLSGYLVLSLLLNDVNGIMTIILDNANSLQQLAYSRGYEMDADLSGFNILREQKINPNGMVSLMKILKAEEDLEIPGFISTHPVTSERINYLTKEIKNNPYSYTPNTKLETSFQALKQIIK
jgi:Zn-dependent protease with chaperone function